MEKIKPTKKLLTIMSALATGWLPWGVEWKPELHYMPSEKPRYDPISGLTFGGSSACYALCCGHTISPKKSKEMIAAGLLEPFERSGQKFLRITERGKSWLGQYWIS